ncbi:hypothetical protein HDE70_002565 [Pedobacter cryoconitis]|nr:hypothetical protein [Pedobacter cryoconitis]
MARVWYSYDDIGSPFSIGSYNRSTFKPACINGSKICAIYAYSRGLGHSVLSNNLRT